MQSLFILYSALAVFGVGVTIVDLFGLLEHAGSSEGGHDGGHDDGGHDAGNDAGNDGGQDDDDGHDGGSIDDHDVGHDDHDGSDHDHEGRGSVVASADAGTRLVARAIGILRTGVYFSLGAGPTGLFAMITGVAPWSSLAWSAGAGVFIAVLSRALRSFIRKDLDSSIKPEEYIMDEATVTVPVTPGAMGKAAVRRYGMETELFIRAKDIAASLSRGAKVRIVDFDDDCYWVETL